MFLAVAEPPLCLAVSVPLALRHAMLAAREDAGDGSERWVPFRKYLVPI